MKQLVEYELEDGSTILVEVDLPEAGIDMAGRGDQIVKAKERAAALDVPYQSLLKQFIERGLNVK